MAVRAQTPADRSHLHARGRPGSPACFHPCYVHRCPPTPARHGGSPRVLTPHDELPLAADGGGGVAGDAGVVAVVLEGDAGDLQGAHELLALDGDARAGEDDVPVLPPGDVDGHVPRGHHAGDVEELPDGGWGELEGLDQRRDCGGERQSTLYIPARA